MNRTETMVQGRTLLKRITVLFVVCVAFVAAFSLLTTNKAYAAKAKGTFKVTSLKWKKSTVDATLSSSFYITNAELSVKAKNTVKGANCTTATIKNTKSGVMLTSYTKKSGGTIRFSMNQSSSYLGKWKVIKAAAAKRTVKQSGSVPGYWDGFGKWQPSVPIYTSSYKSIKSVKKSKPILNVVKGKETKITIDAPKSLLVDEADVSFSATLKDDKGNPVAGNKINFLILDEADEFNANVKPNLVSGTTNSSGVVEVKGKIPKDSWRVIIKVIFPGAAKKYCASENSTKVDMKKLKTEYVVVNEDNFGWDGHTGAKSFNIKLSIAEGKDKGKPLPGMATVWKFKYNDASRPEDVNKEAFASEYGKYPKTNAEGIATESIAMKPNSADWSDYDVEVHPDAESFDKTIYLPPDMAKFTMKKKQGVKKYTIDLSKIKLMNRSGDKDWFLETSLSQKNTMNMVSNGEMLLDESGNALTSATEGTFNTSSTSDKIFYSAKSVTTGNMIAANKAISYKAISLFDLSTPISVASADYNSTEILITFTLSEFENPTCAEYKYVPLTETVSKTFKAQ